MLQKFFLIGMKRYLEVTLNICLQGTSLNARPLRQGFELQMENADKKNKSVIFILR